MLGCWFKNGANCKKVQSHLVREKANLAEHVEEGRLMKTEQAETSRGGAAPSTAGAVQTAVNGRCLRMRTAVRGCCSKMGALATLGVLCFATGFMALIHWFYGF